MHIKKAVNSLFTFLNLHFDFDVEIDNTQPDFNPFSMHWSKMMENRYVNSLGSRCVYSGQMMA